MPAGTQPGGQIACPYCDCKGVYDGPEPKPSSHKENGFNEPLSAIDRLTARFRKRAEIRAEEMRALAVGGDNADGSEDWRRLMKRVGRL